MDNRDTMESNPQRTDTTQKKYSEMIQNLFVKKFGVYKYIYKI